MVLALTSPGIRLGRRHEAYPAHLQAPANAFLLTLGRYDELEVHMWKSCPSGLYACAR